MFTRLKHFFQRWWRTILLLIFIAALALTVRFWLQPLLQMIPLVREFMKDNADEIQGWSGSVQIVLWSFALIVLVYNFALPKASASTSPPEHTMILPLSAETIEQLLAKRLELVDLDSNSKAYLAALVDLYRKLPMTGMGVNNLALEFELLELYVPLKARVSMPEGETWSRSLKLAGRAMSEEEATTIGLRQSEPLALLDLLQQYAGLIVLGDPGAGKSTFMKMLALRAALNQQDLLGIGERIPFLLPLNEFANALEQRELSLGECIGDFWRKRSPDLRVDALLSDALNRGKALVLLDGLDEVRQENLRKRVVDLICHFFVHHKQKGNKFVLTSRIVGYSDVRPATVGLQECTIVDFAEDEITVFVEQWTAAVAKMVHKTSNLSHWDAERERSGLMSSIHTNPGVRQLASNPLLLTILALMKRTGVELPERRADLYETYVKTLLKSWNMARSLGRPLTSDLDEKVTLQLLSPLALWMHEVSPGIGLVAEEDLKRTLRQICADQGLPDPETNSRQLLEDVQKQSSLLLERGYRQYGFIHTTFQEYLAARGVALLGELDRTRLVERLADHIHDPAWHEVSLLTIGYIGLVQQTKNVASAVIDDLLAKAPGEPGQAIVLAGECVADVGQSGVTPACRQKVIDALTETLTNDKVVPAIRRAQAGRVLAHRNLGDPRPEVMTLAGMQFCYVPQGKFVMGSGDDDPDAYADEKPQHEVDITYPYWIGRFPVSNAQFDAFVKADGYQNPAYWQEATQHELWKDGKVQDVWYSRNRETKGWDRNHGNWRKQFEIDEPYSLSNHPVVAVNWYESLAFCRWLTEHAYEQGWLTENWHFTLPNETEWEKAARGGFQIHRLTPRSLVSKLQGPETCKLYDNKKFNAIYPWGVKADPERMNFAGSNIKTTNVLGSYPGGVSPYQVEEMAGNIREWTRSLWGKDGNTPTFVYPYENQEERERLTDSPSILRVLRGGSWYHDEKRTRCSLRHWYFPDNRNYNFGFRVVCVSIPSDL